MNFTHTRDNWENLYLKCHYQIMWKRVPIVSNIKRIIPWFCICTLVCKELSFCRPATTTVFLPNDTSLVGHSRQLFLEKKIWQPTIHYSVTHSRQTQVENTGAAFRKPPVRAPGFEANLTWWPNRAISPKRLFTISLHYERHGYKMENNLFWASHATQNGSYQNRTALVSNIVFP